MAERMDVGRAAGMPSAPLWRSSTAGALLAIAVLVAATIGAAIWLSVLDERRQAQEQLTRQAHYAALQIRGRLVETEQLLLLEGSRLAETPVRFQRNMTELLQANPALLRVELRRRDGAILAAVDAPAPRPTLPAAIRNPLSPEGTAAFETAARQNRLSYSRPYFMSMGTAGFDLMELVVPTGDVDGPMIVATYAPQRILEHFLPTDAPRDALYSLVEADGTVAARQAPLGQSRGPLHAISPLARTGATLQVRVDATREGPNPIPSVLTGLVAATSLGLGLAMFFLVRDVRQREQVERELREQVVFRRAVEDAMLHALGVYDTEGRCVQVNEAACRLSGYSREELVGQLSPMPFATPESVTDTAAYRRRIELADESERDALRSRGFETRYRRRDGTVISALVYESPVRDVDGTVIGRMLIAVDLTEQKRIEDLSRRQQEALQTHSRLATLGEMASTLSHELNQPLAAITSYAAACENLVGARPARPDAVGQALRGIKTQAERAGQVIRSVQSFLRRRAVDRVDVDLGALVHGLDALLRLQAARTGSRFEVDIPADTVAHADRIMLEQVLLNLTRNGFEAMADTPPQLRLLEVRARARPDAERGDRIEVVVADRGKGVPPEAVPQLFTAFFTTKSEGMGLGLSLCRSVIEQHGGQLVHRARADGGTEFVFDLPRRSAPSAPNPDLPSPGADS